jgi:hypothetical protein
MSGQIYDPDVIDRFVHVCLIGPVALSRNSGATHIGLLGGEGERC